MQERDFSEARIAAPSSDSPATSADSTTSVFSPEDVNRIRALRAKRIEEIASKLTDLVTVICGRAELLLESAPLVCQKELLAIRDTAKNGVAFSLQLLQAVEACRKEIGASHHVLGNAADSY
jgi:hypothetical protein